MSISIFVSYLVLWGVVLIQAFMILNLYQKIRNNKVKKQLLAKSEYGLKRKEAYPAKQFYSLQGEDISIVNHNVQGTVLLFTSSDCSICKRLYPIIPEIKNKYPKFQFVIFVLGTDAYAKEIISYHKLQNIPVVLLKDEQLPKLGVSGFPFTYLLSTDGNVIEKGIVNYREHFDILLSHSKAS